eukprot:CAMPEP_0119313142 /NCGR_PEP_ID=MMETSP1333-20130426/28011_1 /TAXON_ID=418940 /ORGANISM="Scyphosphaera apsteinii, Strain RCC1455" /LENGTH=57 /DNA_ID=CAMNT_0007317899 /DNA_START=82 /DNA_END=255 /DNA_ORIENTATION=-
MVHAGIIELNAALSASVTVIESVNVCVYRAHAVCVTHDHFMLSEWALAAKEEDERVA